LPALALSLLLCPLASINRSQSQPSKVSAAKMIGAAFDLWFLQLFAPLPRLL
jgi:hypothetical protein